jgi:hypothetical protein
VIGDASASATKHAEAASGRRPLPVPLAAVSAHHPQAPNYDATVTVSATGSWQIPVAVRLPAQDHDRVTGWLQVRRATVAALNWQNPTGTGSATQLALRLQTVLMPGQRDCQY